MRILLLVLLTLFPLHTQAESLRRSARDTAPKTLALTKDFFHFEDVQGTCTRRECHTVNFPQRKEICHDESKFQNVCHDQFGCKMVNGQRKCGYEKKCGYEWTRQKVCEYKYVNVPTNICQDHKEPCTKQKKVVDRTWKVALTAEFDARAQLKRGQDEKFEVALDGDEHEPKLTVKALRSPFKYATDYRFGPNADSANLEFRLSEAP